MSDYINIHLHTDFSCLDGFGTVTEYAEKAVKNGIKYLCVTDHGMGAAYPRMIEECKRLDLKPIFGCEVYVNNHHHLVESFSDLSEEMKSAVRKNYHLVLLAKNNTGYENLVKLISDGWINGFYYKPRVSWEKIKKYSEGLICTSACLGGEVPQLILNKKHKEAFRLIQQYKEVFGDDYYLEIQMINMKEQDEINPKIIEAAKAFDIPLVITNDTHYCEKEDSFDQTVELLLNSKGTLSNRAGLEFHTDSLWYKTTEDMDNNWKENYQDSIPKEIYEEAKRNTNIICEKCNVEIDVSPKFPKIPNAENMMMSDCISAMKKMNLYDKKEYKERLLKEFEVIFDKGYTSYFMIVKDIIDHAKQIGSSVGCGRGCFAPYCKVIKENQEIVPIKNIKIGDKVLSHDGTYQKVLNKYEYIVKEKLVYIKTNSRKEIVCTSDHKIFIAENTCKQAIMFKTGDKIYDIKENFISVLDIKTIPYEGTVYDLNVEKTNSYNINGIAVHNSGAGSLICYLLGITQVDPIKHDLLFERFLSPSRGGKFAKMQFSDKDLIS